MGYRDPKIHAEQLRFRTMDDECERVALAKYGVSLYDLPEVLRYAIIGEMYPASPYTTNRRFDSNGPNWRRWDGWRAERDRHRKQREAVRLATIEVRRKRTGRKVHARRFGGRRPELPVDEEA